MMQDKKAASHIEMVVSFAMFALFVFFLLIYLNPIRNQNISDVLLDSVQKSMEKNATIQLIELPLNLKIGVDFCFSLTNPFNTTDSRNILVKDYTGKVLKFSLSGEQVNVEKSGNFYYLYFADAIFSTQLLEAIQCTQLNISDYNYAASRTYDIFFLPRMQGIKNVYATDYNKLREDFNFPLGYDFAINVTDSATKQGILSMSTKKPEGVEIIARDLPIEILYDDGRMVQAVMNMQVW